MATFRYIAIALLFALGFVSCKSVYYNTFYNARQAYMLAEKSRADAEAPGSRLTSAVYRELYKRVIAKSSAVLELYPKSKWVDDALLLIAKSFYWREEYSDALVKYQELQENFPKSPLLAETFYWQGLTLWALNRTEDARFSFSFVDQKTDPELFGLANLALAEIEAGAQSYESAIESYQSLIAQLGSKDKLRALAWQGIGTCLYKLGRSEELIALNNVLISNPEPAINFETRAQIGKALEEQGRFDEALAAYNNILKIKRLRIYEAETQLRQANVFRLKEDYAVSEETYERVAQKYPRTKYSAEAYYRMGLINQLVHLDLEKAKDFFEKASREDRQSEAGEAALQRRKDLLLIDRYRLQAQDAKDPKMALAPLFNLAELYLFNLGETDSALAIYQRALALADTSSFAPKALYAIGLIYSDSLNNETDARESFLKLIEKHPNTPYARDARTRIQYSGADDALAEARFMEAEDLKREGMAPGDYIPLLRQIASEYPNSSFAPQALFAVAWAYENEFDQLDEARDIYQQVKETYPLTRFAEIADQKLAGNFLTPPKPKETAPDSSARVPPGESPSTLSPPGDANSREALDSQNKPPVGNPLDNGDPPDLIPLEEADVKPELTFSSPPKFPPSAGNTDRPVSVVVRLLILRDGSVFKADPLSGPTDFYSAAILSAVTYRFSPAQKDGQPKSVWIELPIVFLPSD
ncbi:MAG: tetratricopeptide repeat protein [bacterium]|nr:tetratricopeptide repeat protein [bacterium]